MKKSYMSIFIILLLIVLLCGCETHKTKHLVRDDWADDVKIAINDFVDGYGINSKNYDKSSYVVFDFDNSASIFDVEEQLIIYQLQTMAFAISPEQLPNILATGLSDLEKDLTKFGYGKGSYRDWILDITNAYTVLYQKYGPFQASGLDEETQQKIQLEPQWLEFSTKMCALYDLVYENESASVAYPWILYWFTGMSVEEVYSLAKASHTYYQDKESEKEVWTSPKNIESNVGVLSYTWTKGIEVTKNIQELWKVLTENGIDVWVCSASGIDVIRAGIDAFGLHDYCTGVLAMTNKQKNGLYVNEYDYENGCCWYATEDGGWIRGTIPSKAQTQGKGKVIAIDNVLVKKYGQGPLAGFMDSTGDFNFCTEYKTLKLVVCFNRATQNVTDGGGLIAELAIYERDTLCYDLEKANANGDTLYVLQGRDENGTRTFRNSNKSLLLGMTEEKLFANKDNLKQLSYIIENKMSIEDAINTFALKTESDSSKNQLGFEYGFLTEYDGYHTK